MLNGSKKRYAQGHCFSVSKKKIKLRVSNKVSAYTSVHDKRSFSLYSSGYEKQLISPLETVKLKEEKNLRGKNI